MKIVSCRLGFSINQRVILQWQVVIADVAERLSEDEVELTASHDIATIPEEARGQGADVLNVWHLAELGGNA